MNKNNFTFRYKNIRNIYKKTSWYIAALESEPNLQVEMSWHDQQKQPPEVFCKKRCSQKFRKFRRKTPMLEGLQALLKKRLQHRYFPVKFAKFLRTSMLKNIHKWLLLDQCETVPVGNLWALHCSKIMIIMKANTKNFMVMVILRNSQRGVI